MSQAYTLILGNQLFKEHPQLSKDTPVIMLESRKLCQRWNYHKYKLAYLITSMRRYAKDLRSQGFDVQYYTLQDDKEFAQVFGELSVRSLSYIIPTNKSFRKYLIELTDKLNIERSVLEESPMFLTPFDVFAEYFESHKRPYKMHNFYVAQRKRLQLFMDGKEPYTGEWSKDHQNRKKTPKDYAEPVRIQLDSSSYKKVCADIERYFPNNPGSLPELYLPTSTAEAQEYLHRFLRDILPCFGDYEDAIDHRHNFLHHSLLSPLLNIGLLTPAEVLSELKQAIEDNPALMSKHYNSIEGFVRQIIGWREWMWGLYTHIYEEDLEQYNFFEAREELPNYFYFEDLAQIEDNPPLHMALSKVQGYAYNHHIERLMILGNWMTLSHYNPHQCYRWFMEMYVDAYEWVMVGNVYGMGTFADGGIFATKPYVAGGNYLKKMSHFGKGEWEQIWTEKFWDFLFTHEKYFSKNPRMNMLIRSRKNKSKNNPLH